MQSNVDIKNWRTHCHPFSDKKTPLINSAILLQYAAHSYLKIPFPVCLQYTPGLFSQVGLSSYFDNDSTFRPN